MHVLYSNSRIFVIPFQWKKTNGSRHDRDTVSAAHALRMRGLHDKRHLLAKLRIAGSENHLQMPVVKIKMAVDNPIKFPISFRITIPCSGGSRREGNRQPLPPLFFYRQCLFVCFLYPVLYHNASK